MNQRGVIDVERNLAHPRQHIVAVLVIENAHILRNQPAERIECEPSHGSFHTAPVQFFHHSIAPLPAESFFGKVISASEKGGEREDKAETKNGNRQPTRERWLSILGLDGSLFRFNYGWHWINLASPSFRA